MNEVDNFIQEKVLPEYRQIIEKFRRLVKADFPELTEEMRGGTEAYYGTPVYRYRRIVLVISPTKKGITFAFSNGAKIKDTYQALEGVGNKAKNIRISTADNFNADIFKDYLKQAIEIDKEI